MSPDKKLDQVGELLINACRRDVGVLSGSFLCQSLSSLNPRVPLCVSTDTKVEKVLEILRDNKIGCVCVTDQSNKLVGIFSERDCLIKITSKFNSALNEPIECYMTKDPVTQTSDGTIAFTLTLMSEGGFRHLPVVDESGSPVGMISIKDVIDAIVSRFFSDLEAMTNIG